MGKACAAALGIYALADLSFLRLPGPPRARSWPLGRRAEASGVPASYAEQFAGVLPDDFSWEEFVEASKRPLRPCVRVNLLKGTVQSVERLGSHHVSWFPDAYWIQQVEATALTEAQELPSAWARIASAKVTSRSATASSSRARIPGASSASSTKPTQPIGWGRDAAFFSGQVYVQEASSLLPVAALMDAFGAPKKDMRLLDMAAAPGGKTTALCAWLANSSAAVVANEPNVARCKVLVENLLRTGSMPKVRWPNSAKPSTG
ncbi:unnamed protein product [Durusdinium trenchii]|uniref:SAM-dependent MTase RsmB/NOP-type domain-containing protein n=1 Tax=Durusdinium trenchii TaxID=1381693 RepID=A0ABP0MXI8_9DINO